MRVTVNGISIEVWEDGHPRWFLIEQGDRIIQFRLEEAKVIRDTLATLIEKLESLTKGDGR